MTGKISRRDGSRIAKREGALVGAIVLEHVSDNVVKLRMLDVEPDAGGLGRRLVLWAARLLDQPVGWIGGRAAAS
jgi:hypothetical protein